MVTRRKRTETERTAPSPRASAHLTPLTVHVSGLILFPSSFTHPSHITSSPIPSANGRFLRKGTDHLRTVNAWSG